MAEGQFTAVKYLQLSLPYLIGNTLRFEVRPSPLRRTMLRKLPSSPGCVAPSPACGYGVFGRGKIHVA
jgi:hypothetical protein